MVSGTSLLNVTSFRIASFYKTNGTQLGGNYARIASGTRFPEPKDNIPDYFRAEKLNNNIRSYGNVRRDIAEALVMIDVAEQAGTRVFEDLDEMKLLVKQYYDADTTDEEKVIIEHAFNETGLRVAETINTAYYDGKKLISDTVGAGVPLKSIILNPDTFTQKYDIDFGSDNVADTSACNITVGEEAATAAVQAESDKAASYLAKVSGYRTGLNAQYNLAENAIVHTKESISSFADTDDAKEIVEGMKRSIAQQSSLAMLAQANMYRTSVVKLLGW